MTSTDLLSLHIQDSRRQRFQDAPDIFFDPKLKQWITFKPNLVVELLRDERLVVPGIVDAIQGLETRYKRQFPNLLYAARCIPLLLEGQVHREIRRNLADVVTEGRIRTTAALPDLMARYVQPMDKETSPEWIQACFIPLVGNVFSHMCDCPESLPFPKLVMTRLFDRFVSLAALEAAEKDIDILRGKLAALKPEVDPAHVIALFILGRDSLVGTLATSLYSVLRQNLNRRLADIEFPDFPPETGVAIAERIAASEIVIGSVTIAAGERVRMFFQPISSADSTVSKQNLFGAGAHSCLGRPISLDVWRAMVNEICRFSRTITSVTCEFEPSNIFVVPRFLKTEQPQ